MLIYRGYDIKSQEVVGTDTTAFYVYNGDMLLYQANTEDEAMNWIDKLKRAS